MSRPLPFCIALCALALGALFDFDPTPTDSARAAARGAEPAPNGRNEGSERGYGRSVHDYRTPEVRLVDVGGNEVDFAAALDEADTAIVGFVFTTCAGVCPVITANMARAIPELDKLDSDYRVFLVSLDPEHDTPTRLREYRERFRTGDRIRFLTGESAAVFEVLRAFNAVYLGGRKMNHQPVTLIRPARHAPWVRLDGLVDARRLAGEVEFAAGERQDARLSRTAR